LLKKPGRVHFVFPRGLLFARRSLLIVLWMIATGGFGLIGILQLQKGVLRGIGPWGVVAVALWLVWLALRRHGSEQHLELSATRVSMYRSFAGRCWARFDARFERGAVRVEVMERQDGWGTPRHYVRLMGPWHRPPRLRCSGEREARWLSGLITHVLGGTGTAESMCRCCGGPIDIDVKIRADGATGCAYCSAVYVVEARRFVFAPLRLPAGPVVPVVGHGAAKVGGVAGLAVAGSAPIAVAAPGASALERHADGETSWVLRPGEVLKRAFFTSGLLAAFAFFAFAAERLCFWLIPDVGRTAPWGLLGVLAMAGVAAAFMAGFSAILGANIAWGATRLRIGEGTIGYDLLLAGRRVPRWLQLGGWETYRALLGMDPALQGRVNIFVGFTLALGGQIALLRLTELRLEAQGGVTRLVLISPLRTMTVQWRLPPRDSAHLQERLLATVGERSTALGRAVVEVETASP